MPECLARELCDVGNEVLRYQRVWEQKRGADMWDSLEEGRDYSRTDRVLNFIKIQQWIKAKDIFKHQYVIFLKDSFSLFLQALFLFLLMCMCMSLCEFMFITSVQGPDEARGPGGWSLGAGVTVGCELPDVGAGKWMNQGLLECRRCSNC